ncbi:MAG: YqaE/Pmp3 family membrane protein [Bacteroidota bacterium]
MKKLKQIALILLALSFGLSSCTLEKRVYLPGYHVEWKKAADKSEKQNLAQSSNPQVAPSKNVIEPASAVFINDSKNNLTISENNMMASVDNPAVVNTVVSKDLQKKIRQTVFTDSKVKLNVRTLLKAKRILAMKGESNNEPDLLLLYILCFFIPFVAVGIVTDWETGPVILNIILCLLCGIPGIIHALIVVSGSR